MLDVDHLTGSLSNGQVFSIEQIEAIKEFFFKLFDWILNFKIYRLSAVAVRVFRNSDSSCSMANTPTKYWGGTNLSDYMTLSVKEILPLMNIRFTSVATDKMNGAQLGIIYTKGIIKTFHFLFWWNLIIKSRFVLLVNKSLSRSVIWKKFCCPDY